MVKEHRSIYAKSIDRVCTYIYANLGGDLAGDTLAKVAGFSKFHFHRQFSAYTGLSVFRFVQLIRLKKASYQLVFMKDKKVIDIAFDAGFESPEAFARSFKKAFGQTPRDFRQAPKWEPWHEHYQFNVTKSDKAMDVKIIETEHEKVAAFEHKGPTESMNHSIAKFIEWRKETGLSPVKTARSYGVPYTDPAETEPSEFRYDICGSVTADVPPNKQGVVTKVIPGGRCAYFRYEGPRDEQMSVAIRDVYSNWLPDSGEELRDFPPYCQFLNLYPETPEHELVTDIFIPLK